MTLEQIITLVTLIAGLIGAIATLIPTLVKLFKTAKELLKNKNWSKLKEIAMTVMKEVEDYYKIHPSMTSQEKLNMAIDIIKLSAASLEIDLNEEAIRDLISYINQTIKWANDMKKDS